MNAMRDTAYRPQSIDTSIEADRFAFKLLRQKSNSDRIAMTEALTRGAKELSLISLKRTFSHLSASEFAVISEESEWEQAKFDRRCSESELYFISPEDIVLSKLLWRKKSQSEKQWRDVLGVLKVQGSRLDFEYLEAWANRLKL